MQRELAEKEDELEIITDDDEQEAPEEQKVEAQAEEPEQEAANDDEELENYSDSVQRRIRKLTSKYREEERQREAAVQYAEAVKKQNEELQQRLNKLDESYVGEFGNRLESQVLAAKEAYKKAYEDGDADAMFDAQQNISRLAMEQARYDEIKQRNAAPARTEAAPQPEAPRQQQPARPDPKAEAWAGKNEWFGSDQTMTYAAFGIHRQLIEDEGFDPTSDEYYTELDRRVRSEFPHKFQNSKRDTGPRVASAESTASKSSSPKGRRTVKLTPSQIAIAKRLNVPLEEYAKYVKE